MAIRSFLWTVVIRFCCNIDTDQKRRVQRQDDMNLFLRSLKNKDKTFLKGGSYHFRLPEELKSSWGSLCESRQKEVKEAMQHFWTGYK